MKTIGLLGGMSWESSTTYYQIINEEIREKLGGLHSAKCIMASVDFAEIEACQSEGNSVFSLHGCPERKRNMAAQNREQLSRRLGKRPPVNPGCG